MKAKFTDCNITVSGNTTLLIFEISPDSKYSAKEIAEEVKQKKGKVFSLAVAEWRNKRSNDANSYCWLLCQKLAELHRTTKEEIYRKYIRAVGQFEIIPIKNEAVDFWINNWGKGHVGRFAEVLADSKIKGYKNIISYFGSSDYDTKQMSILIDEIVEDCKFDGIEVMTPAELELLKGEWGK